MGGFGLKRHLALWSILFLSLWGYGQKSAWTNYLGSIKDRFYLKDTIVMEAQFHTFESMQDSLSEVDSADCRMLFGSKSIYCSPNMGLHFYSYDLSNSGYATLTFLSYGKYTPCLWLYNYDPTGKLQESVELTSNFADAGIADNTDSRFTKKNQFVVTRLDRWETEEAGFDLVDSTTVTTYSIDKRGKISKGKQEVSKVLHPSVANKSITISWITGNFYHYTTSRTFPGNPPESIPANGMYLVTDSGAVLFDTPFDTTQFRQLLHYIDSRHHKKVVLCLATHSHIDRTAGLKFYANLGIPTYTSEMTDSISISRNEKRAEHHFRNDTLFTIGKTNFQVFYPGKGHAPDNIVVWFPGDKILYGGCFVKSTEATDLGNFADADVQEWKVSMEKVMKKFPDIAYVIPGHFGGMEPKALKHTLKLIKKQIKQQ